MPTVSDQLVWDVFKILVVIFGCGFWHATKNNQS
jgi:hypothetical protein